MNKGGFNGSSLLCSEDTVGVPPALHGGVPPANGGRRSKRSDADVRGRAPLDGITGGKAPASFGWFADQVELELELEVQHLFSLSAVSLAGVAGGCWRPWGALMCIHGEGRSLG